MLVLSREIGDRIRVDGPCVIELVATGGKRSKIGIVAASETKILRDELEDHGHLPTTTPPSGSNP